MLLTILFYEVAAAKTRKLSRNRNLYARMQLTGIPGNVLRHTRARCRGANVLISFKIKPPAFK